VSVTRRLYSRLVRPPWKTQKLPFDDVPSSTLIPTSRLSEPKNQKYPDLSEPVNVRAADEMPFWTNVASTSKRFWNRQSVVGPGTQGSVTGGCSTTIWRAGVGMRVVLPWLSTATTCSAWLPSGTRRESKKASKPTFGQLGSASGTAEHTSGRDRP